MLFFSSILQDQRSRRYLEFLFCIPYQIDKKTLHILFARTIFLTLSSSQIFKRYFFKNSQNNCAFDTYHRDYIVILSPSTNFHYSRVLIVYDHCLCSVFCMIDDRRWQDACCTDAFCCLLVASTMTPGTPRRHRN